MLLYNDGTSVRNNDYKKMNKRFMTKCWWDVFTKTKTKTIIIVIFLNNMILLFT